MRFMPGLQRDVAAPHASPALRRLGRRRLPACGYARVMASPARHRALRAAAGDGIDAQAVAAEARELGVMGWVRPTGELHAEGEPDAVRAFVESLGHGVATERARVEGHE